jgi:hypothetical protein
MIENNNNNNTKNKKELLNQLKINKKKLEKIQSKFNNNLIRRREKLKINQIEANNILKSFTYEQPIELKKSKNKNKNNKTFLPLIKSPKPKPKYKVKFIKVEKKNFLDNSENNSNNLLDKNIENINFEDYLRIQSKIESRFRLCSDDDLTELLNFMKKINEIRQNLMEKEVDKIMNTDDRYNDEIPEEDTKINLEDKGLLSHKWKNIFSLQEYQNFFLDELKGKISSLNYRAMLKKFKQISKICFSSGHVNYGAIQRILGQEY